jgi:anti-sigma-K factor RskA
MVHVDPEILATLAVGGAAGSAPDMEHVANCPDCAAELRLLSDIASMAASAGLGAEFRLESPPAAVWERISAQLGLAEIATERAPRNKRLARLRGLAAIRRPIAIAAAGLIVGAAAAVTVQDLTARPPLTRTIARIALRPLPEFPQWHGASGTADLEQGAAGQFLKVTIRAASRTGYFEVWLLGRDGSSMISLGDLNSRQTGKFSLPPGVNLSFYSRIDVSLQPFNGSTLHSRFSVVRGSLPTR